MKRFTIHVMLTLVMVSMVSLTQISAQTYEDAVVAFNQATEMAQNNNVRGAIDGFRRVIQISDQLGPEGAEIKGSAQAQIPMLYFSIARDLVQTDLAAAAAAFEETARYARMYGNEQLATRSLNNVPQLYLNQGSQFLRADRLDEALEMYDKALSFRPNYAAAFYQKGLVFRQRDNMDEALSYFDRAIQVGATSNERNIVELATNAARNFLLLKGVGEMEARRYRPATQLLLQAVQYDEANADLHYRLAEVYNKQALWSQAIESANKSLEFETGSRIDRAKIYFELGYALKNSGNFSGACDAFSNAAFGNFRAAAEHEIEHELKCNTPNRR
jgi:tetratricopeptide (TPR) repeat protein